MLKTTYIDCFREGSQLDTGEYTFSSGRLVTYVKRDEEARSAQIATLKDPLGDDTIEHYLDKDEGLECTRFPKFKMAKASELRVGDEIKVREKLVISEITKDNDYLDLTGNSITLKVHCDEIIDVSMFREKEFPDYGDKFIYWDELNTIESVISLTCNNTEYYQLKFTNGESSHEFKKGTKLLFASHHLTESDAR